MKLSLFTWLEHTILRNEYLGDAEFVANINGKYETVTVKGVSDPYELSEIIKYDMNQNSIDPTYYVFLEERVDSYRLGLLNNIKKYHFNNNITFRELLNVKIRCKNSSL